MLYSTSSQERPFICQVHLRRMMCSERLKAVEHPPSQRHLCSVSKIKLTSYSMSTYSDQPPVPWYTSPNSDSLLNWSTGGQQQMV